MLVCALTNVLRDTGTRLHLLLCAVRLMNGHEDDGDDRCSSGSVSGPRTLILAQDQGAEQLRGPSKEMYRGAVVTAPRLVITGLLAKRLDGGARTNSDEPPVGRCDVARQLR